MATAAPVLQVDGLSQRFGAIDALVDVSFALDSVGLLAILGPNGAGKTTLLDIVEGLATPTRGSFRLFGGPPKPYPKHRTGVVMQNEVRLERCTTREYAELFAAIHRVRCGADKILEWAELGSRAHIPMLRLSGGEAARLFIATAIVHEPELVFLDEPTAHLDPDSKRRVGKLLSELSKHCAIVMATHDLREADAISDHLLFLVDGKVRAKGSRQDLIDQVPVAQRRGLGVEDAFFHFCSITLGDGGTQRKP